MGHDKSNSQKILGVIGGGVASSFFLYDLAQSYEKGLTLPFSHILWISSPELVPGCSLWSTALVAAHGVRHGLSALGDDLYESHQIAQDFYQNWSGLGVEKIHLTYFEDEKKSVARRFGENNLTLQSYKNFHAPGVQEDAFLINPQVFLKSLEQKILETLPMVEKKNDVILNFEPLKNELSSIVKNYPCHNVFWGVGSTPYIDKTKFGGKAITGHVLRYDDVDLGKKSFAFNIFGKNLIYRCDSTGKTLFLGATTAQDADFFPDAQTLLEQGERLFSLDEFTFLKDLSPVIWGGIRHKLSKRRPRIEQLNSQEFCALGFYKNGYTFAPLAAQRAREWWAN